MVFVGGVMFEYVMVMAPALLYSVILDMLLPVKLLAGISIDNVRFAGFAIADVILDVVYLTPLLSVIDTLGTKLATDADVES